MTRRRVTPRAAARPPANPPALTPRPAPPQLIKGLLEHEVWEREEFAGAAP